MVLGREMALEPYHWVADPVGLLPVLRTPRETPGQAW